MVDVVQLVRASDCGSECRGFESHLPPHKKQEGVSKCTHPLFYAQSPDFLKPGLCYFLKFLYL